MYCSKCGAEVNGKYCAYCGAKVVPPVNADPKHNEATGAVAEQIVTETQTTTLSQPPRVSVDFKVKAQEFIEVCNDKIDSFIKNIFKKADAVTSANYSGDSDSPKDEASPGEWFFFIGAMTTGIITTIIGHIWWGALFCIIALIVGPVFKPYFTLPNRNRLEKISSAFIALVFILLLVNASIGLSHVDHIKSGCPEAYPDTTFGEAFNDYFFSPSWKYIGDDTVEFTGWYYDNGIKSKAKIQFREYGSKFKAVSLSVNDIPQTDWEMAVLIVDAFEEYKN